MKNISIFEKHNSILAANAEATIKHFSTCSMAQSVFLSIMQKVFINM